MTQKMEAKYVYNLDDLKKFKESGASAEEVRNAYAMMPKNKELLKKAMEGLVYLDWGKVSLDQVKDLVERGADVRAEDEDGVTPLHRASRWARLDVVEYLIAQGADMEAKNDQGKTPLYGASGSGHLDVVEYLITHGADMEAKDEYGETPLYEASGSGRLDVVKYLVEHGADMEAKDKWGETPLHEASKNGHLDVVKCLVEHGADVKAKDNYGRTPLHWAREEGHAEVVAYFAEQRDVPQRRSEKAKEIRLVDADHAGQPVDHSLRRMLFGGKRLRQNAPLSPIVAERFRKRQDRS